jgi:hypothetical protein
MTRSRILSPLVPAKAATQLFGQVLDVRFRGHERRLMIGGGLAKIAFAGEKL